MSEEKGLVKKDYDLLLKLIGHRGRQSNKVFDKQDYCFQSGMRKAAKLIGVTEHRVRKLFDTLTDKGLLRAVLDINGNERKMLNPSFMKLNRDEWERWFNRGVFALRSHSEAAAWSEACVGMGMYISPDTGELLGVMDVVSLKKYREGYTSTDRSKRRDERKAFAISLPNMLAANDGDLRVAA